jgi:hypothetical protein
MSHSKPRVAAVEKSLIGARLIMNSRPTRGRKGSQIPSPNFAGMTPANLLSLVVATATTTAVAYLVTYALKLWLP